VINLHEVENSNATLEEETTVDTAAVANLSSKN
jgi:hypothetical protein